MPPETVESTPVTEPANDLTSDLEAAFEQYQEEETDPSSEADTSQQEEQTGEEEQASSDGEEETAGDEEAQEEQGGEEEQKTAAPEHWKAEHKELFEKLDPEGQKFLLERHKEMEGDYTRKRQQDADLIKQAEAFQPVNEIFKHFPNLQPVPTIQRWASIAQSLEQNPKQTIHQLAQQYRVDLGEQEQGYVDPDIQNIDEKVEGLEKRVFQAFKKEQAVANIQKFSEAKTEAGEPAHPYFNELYPDMIRLAHAERAAGREPSLEKLYQDAQWINPDIREHIQSAQQKAADKKAEEAARAKAEKARKAAKTATSGTGLDSPSDDLGLRAQIESQFN